jgi:hypothetical protein
LIGRFPQVVFELGDVLQESHSSAMLCCCDRKRP